MPKGKTMPYTVSEILTQLATNHRWFDQRAGDMNFPMLGNGYTYPADVRLTAYRDDTRWAVAIEDNWVSRSPSLISWAAFL
jgi:hypothetical protein